MFGPDHYIVARTLHNLGLVEKRLGLMDNAEDAVRRALAIFKATLPERHPATSGARVLLADIVGRRGEVLADVRDSTGPALVEASDPCRRRVVGSVLGIRHQSRRPS